MARVATAGVRACTQADNLLQLPNEYQGVSWLTGGDGDSDTVFTLANALKVRVVDKDRALMVATAPTHARLIHRVTAGPLLCSTPLTPCTCGLSTD